MVRVGLIGFGMAGQSLAGAEASLAVAEICGDLQRLLFFGDSTPAEHHGDPCRPTASRIRRAGAMAAQLSVTVDTATFAP